MARRAHPDLHNTRILVEVATAGSFSTAARALDLPASTVSRRIARLEQELGACVFQRTTRSLQLTAAERTYLQHARRALAALAAGQQAIVDVFDEAWVASRGNVEERLPAAFRRARERFNDPDTDFPDDLPSAVMLAVATVEDAAHAAWIGGDITVVARGFVASAETTLHTLREPYKRQHPDEAADPDPPPNVLVRTLGPRARQGDRTA